MRHRGERGNERRGDHPAAGERHRGAGDGAREVDDENGEHHDGPDVDEDLDRGEEIRPQHDVQGGDREERKGEVQGGMEDVAAPSPRGLR